MTQSALRHFMTGVVVVSTILAVVEELRRTRPTQERSTYTWSGAIRTRQRAPAILKLEARGVVTGYADCWVSYKLDFLSRGRLDIAAAGFDARRYPPSTQT